MAPKARSFAERFGDLISPEPNTGCWLWLGSLTCYGYGRLYEKGKTKFAHRMSYEQFRGSIPPNLHIDHLCRVRCCVNPYHLEPVSLAENIRRGETGKWQKAITHCPYGHEYTPANTIVRDLSRVCRRCYNARQAKGKRRRRAEAKARDKR